MRKQVFGIALLLTLISSSAYAVGTRFGLRLGVGPGFGDGSKGVEEANINSFSVGAALEADLTLVAIELDLLYTQVTAEFGGIEAVSSDFDVPIIASLSLPLVPTLLDANVGIGLQPRFHISSEVEGEEVENDETESMVLYLPLVVGARLSLGPLGAGLDIRYLYQLSEAQKGNDDRVHHLMFFGGLFF